MDKVQIGDFITIPAWKIFGMVQEVRPCPVGSEDAIRVLLQEHPEQPARTWKYYNLEPGEYTNEGQ